MQADYRKGVLYLVIPVAEQAQPRRIEIGQTADQSGGPHVSQGQPQTSGTG